jgi:Ribbon-helix-helix protein, copG family
MAKRVRDTPATGHDPVSAIRLSTNLTAAIDKWAAQMGLSSRAQAIRRSIEFGLAGAQPTKRRAPKAAAKASKLAAQQIDKLADRSATAEEQQKRKRRLLKGPREFREMRADLSKPKKLKPQTTLRTTGTR